MTSPRGAGSLRPPGNQSGRWKLNRWIPAPAASSTAAAATTATIGTSSPRRPRPPPDERVSISPAPSPGSPQDYPSLSDRIRRGGRAGRMASVTRAEDRPTWLGSDRRLARAVGQPIAGFLRVEAAGGVVLLAAAVVALAWANSPWRASYTTVWTTDVSLTVGRHTVEADLRHWINDGLMALFFFVLGLEIKQELVGGQLASWRAAAVPALAALGGMVVPALIYAAVNHGGPGAAGWGIPMATDVAFSLGVLALLG